MDPKNRNSVESNLPENEITAMIELKELIKEKEIVACDKGAGIIILDGDKYIEA